MGPALLGSWLRMQIPRQPLRTLIQWMGWEGHLVRMHGQIGGLLLGPTVPLHRETPLPLLVGSRYLGGREAPLT